MQEPLTTFVYPDFTQELVRRWARGPSGDEFCDYPVWP
jgi:hypothetical protein